MTVSEIILKALTEGMTLRFYDHGSGTDRRHYCELLHADGALKGRFSSQILYRLRKQTKITYSHANGDFDYYRLKDKDAEQEA